MELPKAGAKIFLSVSTLNRGVEVDALVETALAHKVNLDGMWDDTALMAHRE